MSDSSARKNPPIDEPSDTICIEDHGTRLLDRVDLSAAPGRRKHPASLRLERILSTLAGADSNRVLQRDDEDLAVADFPCVRGLPNRLNHFFPLVRLDSNFDLDASTGKPEGAG
jgi:hypothetical protein